MVTATAAFWDSSVLVPLCLTPESSPQARAFSEQFSMVVWWSAPAEICSAVARLHRSGKLPASARLIALDRLANLRREWDEVPPSDAVRDKAEFLLDLYPLRAADGLRLAAALVWCRNRPVGRTFICADGQLCEAAAQAGFTVLQPRE